MLVVKTHFDGKQVIIPEENKDLSPREVILVFTDKSGPTTPESEVFSDVSESAFAKIWDNIEDSIYDRL